jgi:hypothetical protein
MIRFLLLICLPGRSANHPTRKRLCPYCFEWIGLAVHALGRIMFPLAWYEALNGAPATTYRVAICLLHLHWKEGGGPIKLPNGMLRTDGVNRQAKWRGIAPAAVELGKEALPTFEPLGSGCRIRKGEQRHDDCYHAFIARARAQP